MANLRHSAGGSEARICIGCTSPPCVPGIGRELRPREQWTERNSLETALDRFPETQDFVRRAAAASRAVLGAAARCASTRRGSSTGNQRRGFHRCRLRDFWGRALAAGDRDKPGGWLDRLGDGLRAAAGVEPRRFRFPSASFELVKSLLRHGTRRRPTRLLSRGSSRPRPRWRLLFLHHQRPESTSTGDQRVSLVPVVSEQATASNSRVGCARAPVARWLHEHSRVFLVPTSLGQAGTPGGRLPSVVVDRVGY